MIVLILSHQLSIHPSSFKSMIIMSFLSFSSLFLKTGLNKILNFMQHLPA